jgi:ATP-dependent Clp protease protease subunit
MSDQSRPLEPAEIAVLNAEAAKHDAERALFAAQARKADLDTESSRLSLDKKIREEQDELAKDTHHHVYVFDKDVSDESVKTCIRQLTTWTRQNENAVIELQINSPGGSIFAGLALVDFIRRLQSKGHTINTVAFGMAASMGGVLLQVGDTRTMGKNAILLIHQGSLGAIGSVGEVEDRMKLMDLFHERILDIFEERSRPVNPKTTKAFIKKNWDRKDWWLTADKALELGFVDEVR